MVPSQRRVIANVSRNAHRANATSGDVRPRTFHEARRTAHFLLRCPPSFQLTKFSICMTTTTIDGRTLDGAHILAVARRKGFSRYAETGAHRVSVLIGEV